MNLSNFEYFIVLGICVIFPLLLTLFHPNLHLKKNLKQAVLAIFITAIPFWIWDIVAVILGHWDFNQNHIVGFYIYNLPIEEVLFFIVIPFCCLTIWAEIRSFKTSKEFWDLLLLKKK